MPIGLYTALIPWPPVSLKILVEYGFARNHGAHIPEQYGMEFDGDDPRFTMRCELATCNFAPRWIGIVRTFTWNSSMFDPAAKAAPCLNI